MVKLHIEEAYDLPTRGRPVFLRGESPLYSSSVALRGHGKSSLLTFGPTVSYSVQV
jgi:hypothetical protein